MHHFRYQLSIRAISICLATLTTSDQIYAEIPWSSSVSIDMSVDHYEHSAAVASPLEPRARLILENYISPENKNFYANIDLGFYHHAQENLSEAYVTNAKLNWHYSDNTTAFVGLLRETWGRVDELNAVNFAYAEDKRWRFLYKKDIRQLARAGAGINWKSFDHSLTFTVYPKAFQHKQPEITSSWCDSHCVLSDIKNQQALYTQQGITADIVAKDSSDAEIALRFQSRWKDLDYALSAFYGNDHATRIARTWISPNTVQLREISPQNLHLGIDGAYSIGPVVLRGEMGYYHKTRLAIAPETSEFLLDDDGYRPTDLFATAIALEHNAPWDIFINLQYLYTHIDKDRSLFIAPQDSQLTSILITKTLYSPEITYKWQSTYDREEKGVFHNIDVSWNISQQWTLSLGKNHFNGQKAISDYRLLEKNNHFYLTTTYYL